MTSSAAFRCVQAWLLEKPAAWADEDAPCLAAALMAQRPPCDTLRKRPREHALLEAERSHQRARIAGLDEELLDEMLRGLEQKSPPADRRPQRYHRQLGSALKRTEFSACGWRSSARSSRKRTDEREQKDDPELSFFFLAFSIMLISNRRSCSKR